MSPLVLGVEWKEALARKRDLVACVVAPLVLVLVVATGAAPEGARPAVYAALFAACGITRTALPMFRDRERGMALRVVRAGVSPSSYLLQRAAAGATLSSAQLLPALLVAVVLLGASVSGTRTAVVAFVLALWIVSLLGALVATVSRSRAEVGAFCAVGLLLLLHMSGVFHTPEPGGFGAVLESLSPLRALHEAFATLVSGEVASGLGAGVAWALVLPAAAVASAPRLVRPSGPRGAVRSGS